MVPKNNCCMGCGACYNVCPVKCISMQLDKRGILYPEISEEECIHCGLCEKACPICNDVPNYEQIYPLAYAAKHTDKAVLKASASGAMFTAFIQKWKGSVWGVCFDENNLLYYKKIEDETDIAKMRGSKYVQSIVGDSFRQIKEDLDKGIPTLFIGLPCHIAGLKTFLKKDYSHLLLVDLVCHGSPSSTLYQQYAASMEKQYGKIDFITHTDKSFKWVPIIEKNIRIEFNKKVVLKDFIEDFYLYMFLKGCSYRPYCYHCKFASMPRNSDITIGDFWGYGILTKKILNTEDGISQVIVNTKKGKKFYDSLANIENHPCELKACLYGNQNLWKPSANKEVFSKKFYDYFSSHTYDELVSEYSKYMNTNKLRKFIRKKFPGFSTFLLVLSYKKAGIDRRIDEELKALAQYYKNAE